MIRRTYPALDVTPGALRAVALHRKARGVALVGHRVLPVPKGTLALSMREPNIADPGRFVAAVKEVLDPLAGGEDRIALSLPDETGRILLTESETPFRSRKEGVDILKWQLKNSLPGDPKEIQLDYQVLKKSESGRYSLAVAVISSAVLAQYEEVLAGAGYCAAVVDFRSLHVYNYYRPRLEMGEEFILVGVQGGCLSLQYFQDRIPVFHRAREVQDSTLRVFQELSHSAVGCHENFPGFRRATVFLHSDWADPLPLAAVVRSALERDELVQLEPHLNRIASVSQPVPQASAGTLVAAIGAGERML